MAVFSMEFARRQYGDIPRGGNHKRVNCWGRGHVSILNRWTIYANQSIHDSGFCIQYTQAHMPVGHAQGRSHYEESLVLGNTDCWSRGGIYDVSSRRVTGDDCSANGDQPCGVVGHGIEDSFQLGKLLRAAFDLQSKAQ
jgi:hypothetical protein